jgi:GT2 family glycosyltransferase
VTGRALAPAVTVVIATRDRRDSLLRSLGRLAALPERPPLVVVDNASADGTPAAVRRRFPQVELVELPANRGATARNVGVARSATRHVAFADDDSWWTPGSLTRAVAALDRHPRLAVVVARVELEPDGTVDAVSRKLALGRLGREPGLPGPRVLSFPACAAVVRREAFAQVGGFSPLLFFGGEEQLLATDLAAAGWQLVYVDAVVVRHAPANPQLTPARWALQERNDVLVRWLRRPWPAALGATLRLARQALTDPAAAGAVAGLLWRLPAALRDRRPVPAALEQQLRQAERPAAPLT